MGKRLLLMALCLGLTILSACSEAPAAPSPTPGDRGADALIEAASQLIGQGEYSAAGAVLDQLDESALGADAVQALGLLRGTLKARLLQEEETTPVAVVTAPPLETLAPSLSPEADPALLNNRQQEVNIFLTAFAETGLTELPGDHLIDFALDYLRLHQADALEEGDDGRLVVPAQQVEQVISRFFSLETRHSSGEGYTYREGHYEFPGRTTADRACLAVASSAVSLGGGQYAVTFDRYAGEPGEDLSAFFGFTSQEIAVSRLDYVDSGEAILQAVVWEGRETFQLVEYKLTN